jgi:hypothetical protein
MKAAILLALLGLEAIASQSAGQTPQSASNSDNATAAAPMLADSDVTQAVEFGKANKNKSFGYRGSANCNGFMQDWLPVYSIVAQGPVARIETASADAARKYATFVLADVSPEMRAPTLDIGVQQAVKQWPDGSLKSEIVPVEHLVIRGFDANGEPGPAVQPTHIEPLPNTWANLLGGKLETKGVLATFDTRAFATGDLQLVVITAGKECRTTIRDKDRTKLQ